MKINAIDLFAGCGGLMDGFEAHGSFGTSACVEWEKSACETLRHRLREKWEYSDSAKRVIRFDIRNTKELLVGGTDIDGCSFTGLLETAQKEKVKIIIGGPPCQAYSIAGRVRDANGMRDDYRNYLFESYLRIVDAIRPDFFIFENVQGLLSASPDGSLISERILKEFDKAEYEVISDLRKAIFDVADFGVPQHRKRVIILGVNRRDYGERAKEIINDFYFEIMPKKKTEMMTVRQAISDLPPIFPVKYQNKKKSHALDSHCGLVPQFHKPRYHNPRDIEVFRMLAADQESDNPQFASAESLKRLYKKVTGKDSNIHKYHVLKWDEPGNTIPAHLHKDGLRHIHPDSKQARSITVREAARLQTFADDFEFYGGQGDAYKMIGNAVPPFFSKKLAESVSELIVRYGI